MASQERGTVDTQDAGIRLDLWLVAHTSVKSRKAAKNALASGKVSIAGAPAGMHDAGRAVRVGEEIVISWLKSGNASGARRMAKAGIEMLYLDDAIAVVNKPAGLLTDTATRAQLRTRDSLRKQLRARLGEQVWPAHRIDRDTTGIVAFARSEALQEVLRAQWAARRPERIYVAIVEGRVQGDGGRWGDWMAWDAKKRVQQASEEGRPHAVFAEADWSVLTRRSRMTSLEVRLVSGRRNQIRVHAMLRGHPLVGEVQYRRGKTRIKGVPRQALHAQALVFDHPVSGDEVRFEAALPADMEALLARR